MALLIAPESLARPRFESRDRPDDPPVPLVDGFGRVHNNMRISVTDRCNFRCTYCMPEEMEFFPRSEILSYEEILRVVQVALRVGITKFRLTGGEPLVRRDLPDLVRAISGLPGVKDLSLTTNGVRLAELAGELRQAGLRRINVSLDALNPDKFAAITRRPLFSSVMKGLEAAEEAGFSPIKVNAVAIRDFTEAEIPAFVDLARRRSFEVRFIEFMPLDGDDAWGRDQVLTSAEILALVSALCPVERVSSPGSSDPATLYRFVDGSGTMGIIPTVTEPFCAHCNRIRLTADGRLRYCLFATEETDLKGPLRAGADDRTLAWLFADTVGAKWAGHMVDRAGFRKPGRNMSQIGG